MRLGPAAAWVAVQAFHAELQHHEHRHHEQPSTLHAPTFMLHLLWAAALPFHPSVHRSVHPLEAMVMVEALVWDHLVVACRLDNSLAMN